MPVRKATSWMPSQRYWELPEGKRKTPVTEEADEESKTDACGGESADHILLNRIGDDHAEKNQHESLRGPKTKRPA
jgi:hypothetical protein